MSNYFLMFAVQTVAAFAGMYIWYRIGFMKGRRKGA